MPTYSLLQQTSRRAHPRQTTSAARSKMTAGFSSFLGAGAAKALAVELAYTFQMGFDGPAALRMIACTALAGILCHYCALLLRETGVRGRKSPCWNQAVSRKAERMAVMRMRMLPGVRPPGGLLEQGVRGHLQRLQRRHPRPPGACRLM